MVGTGGGGASVGDASLATVVLVGSCAVMAILVPGRF
jgi:hypothetical protein